MERLFVYGTLRDPLVQIRVIGRTATGSIDFLDGYQRGTIKLGEREYPILDAAASDNYVEGLVLEVSTDELQRLDIYETSAYRRIRVSLRSGGEAWTYAR
ncbi:MAG TPA: gamma-glutamylcyclotransferase [Aggregatilineales bacterium]|nr:gamma-glutamylcyclotransferase [Anaerolineae bacterium]HUN08795.1 gamma-glutamylcyclotransferase [Aggregatilineales bacterium]